MKRIIIFSLSLVLCLGATLGACVERLSPIEVTERFWAAMQANDTATVRKYIASSSLKREDFESSFPPITSAELGTTLIEEDRAWVETTVVVRRDEPVTVPLETVLVKENGQWKVLYDETVEMLTEVSELARLLERFENLTEQFGQEFDRSLEELQRSLPEVERKIKEMEKKLKAKIPEIKERLEGLAKELEDLFESPQQESPPEKERAI